MCTCVCPPDQQLQFYIYSDWRFILKCWRAHTHVDCNMLFVLYVVCRAMTHSPHNVRFIARFTKCSHTKIYTYISQLNCSFLNCVECEFPEILINNNKKHWREVWLEIAATAREQSHFRALK